MTEDEFAEYISVADASEQYKTSRVYWYDAIKAGKIAGFELPGRRGTFIKKADLIAFWKPRQIAPDEKKDTSA